ncbi:TetR/AcrR family transcriptional regulator [Rhizobium sullae]|uniref:TetR family transcriptional regulator n=1 Tax=Rhizobium sullae TaxID=50338 RepID=A0A4R3QI34_RHISU|nr:TetR/AcrR family transcriptional regulator [Rhizobium sullae]TCU20587.1 TetR family transcriptional regulator [Rhizobium sullae]
MARPRTFDEDHLLTGAMHVFRRQGFAASSVRDLEAATGLTSGSLYNSYGDKRGVFEAASIHYNRTVLARRIEDHAPEGSGIAGLRRLFLSLLHEPDGGSAGCLITNSAVEFGSKDAPGFVAEGLAVLRDTIADRLGDEAEAVALLALYQGALVLIRAGYDKAVLEQMFTHHFETLEKHHGC